MLLQALLCDTLAGYEELQPRFSALTPPPRESDSLAARLVRLAATAQADTARMARPALPVKQSIGPDGYLRMLLHQKLKLAREETLSPPRTTLQRWDEWYAAAERGFPEEALFKLQLLKLRQRQAARVICRAFSNSLEQRTRGPL